MDASSGIPYSIIHTQSRVSAKSGVDVHKAALLELPQIRPVLQINRKTPTKESLKAGGGERRGEEEKGTEEEKEEKRIAIQALTDFMTMHKYMVSFITF